MRCPEHKGDCANAYVGSSEKMAKDLIWLGRLAGVGQRDDQRGRGVSPRRRESAIRPPTNPPAITPSPARASGSTVSPAVIP